MLETLQTSLLLAAWYLRETDRTAQSRLSKTPADQDWKKIGQINKLQEQRWTSYKTKIAYGQSCFIKLMAEKTISVATGSSGGPRLHMV